MERNTQLEKFLHDFIPDIEYAEEGELDYKEKKTYECIREIPSMGDIIITLKNGKKLLISISEWGWILKK